MGIVFFTDLILDRHNIIIKKLHLVLYTVFGLKNGSEYSPQKKI